MASLKRSELEVTKTLGVGRLFFPRVSRLIVGCFMPKGAPSAGTHGCGPQLRAQWRFQVSQCVNAHKCRPALSHIRFQFVIRNSSFVIKKKRPFLRHPATTATTRTKIHRLVPGRHGPDPRNHPHKPTSLYPTRIPYNRYKFSRQQHYE